MQNRVAATAFVTGNVHEVLDDGAGADLEALEADKRDWRSVLMVPVLALRTWVPSALLFVTSNRARPFWSDFGDRHDRYFSQLINEIDETARQLLIP